MSTVGGGFSGDLFEMKNSAAQARMTLDEYTSAIMSNSESLAALGGTVNQGARLFTQFNKDFYETGDLPNQLMALGMGTNEINEALAFQMKIQRRANFEDEKTRKRSVEAATLLAFEMDEIAKLTGKQKDQIQEEIDASMRKGQVEAKFREIEMREGAAAAQAARDSYAVALAGAQKAGPDAVAALEETFVLGTIKGDAARRGAVALGPAFDDLQVSARNAAGATESNAATLQKRTTQLMDNFDSALVARINDPNFLRQAQLAAAGNDMGSAAAQMLEAAGDFETAFSKAGDAVGEQTTADTAGGELTNLANATELTLKDLSAQINDGLLGEGKGLNAFQSQLESAATAVEEFRNSNLQNNVAGQYTSELMELFGGSTPSGTQPSGTVEEQAALDRVGGLILELDRTNEEGVRLLAATISSLGDSPQLAARLQENAEALGMSLSNYLQALADDPSKIQAATGASNTQMSIATTAAGGPLTVPQMIDVVDATVTNMNVTASTVNFPNIPNQNPSPASFNPASTSSPNVVPASANASGTSGTADNAVLAQLATINKQQVDLLRSLTRQTKRNADNVYVGV